MECKNCGAKIKAHEVQCPYCSFMNLEAADRRYMSRLHEIHTGMGMLQEQPKKILRREIAVTMFFTIAGMLLAVGFGFFWYTFTRGDSVFEIRNRDKREEERIAQAEEYFPILDDLYEAGDYAGIMELYENRYESLNNCFNQWEHEAILYAMEYYSEVTRLEQFMKDGDRVYSGDVERAIEGGLCLLYGYEPESQQGRRQRFSENDEKLLETMQKDTERILQEYLHIGPEETEELYQSLCIENYLSYSACQQYADRVYKELFEEGKEAE